MKKFRLWAVLAAALAVRLAHLYFSRLDPFFEPALLDPAYYHEWALRILRSGLSREGVFYGLPLYPLFLSAVYAVSSGSFVLVKVLQAALGVVTVFLVYKTGEELHSERAGLAGAAFAAVYGPLFFHEQLLIPEAIGAPLYAAAFYLSLRLDAQPAGSGARARPVAAGVLTGLAALTKAGILFFAWFFAGYLALRKRSGRGAMLFILAFGAVLAPVTAHNVFRGKDFVWLTSHGGFNFYIGNNPSAEGVFKAPEGTGSNVEYQIRDAKAVAEREAGRGLKPSEVSRHWRAKANRFIADQPFAFLKLLARKFALFFDAREISDVDDYQFAKGFNPFLRLPWPTFALLGPLFFLGLWIGRRETRHRAVLVAWTGLYVFAVLLFFVNARYRLPVLSAVFPVAGIALVRIVDRARDRRWDRIAVYGLGLIAGAALVQMQLVGTDHSRDWVNAGDVFLKKGDPERAIPFYKKALEVRPDSAKAHLALGIANTRLGRHEEAFEQYRRAVELDPGSSEAHNNIGLCYDTRGRIDEAERHFLLALEIHPGNAQAHNNLGMVYAKSGRLEEAIGEFQKSLDLNPASPSACSNLAIMYYKLDRREEAIALWRRALEIDPNFGEAKKALRMLE